MSKRDKTYRIQITVKRVTNGVCSNAMRPGKSWIMDDKTPGGMCLSAFNALLPYMRVLQFGGRFHFHKDPDAPLEFACPDHNRLVIFEVKRLKD
ncbi:MAG: TIGR04076 family protein [Chloroflexi bacterium]|nr:TIGR04076 family protein [Chloroflexota bacterium]